MSGAVATTCARGNRLRRTLYLAALLPWQACTGSGKTLAFLVPVLEVLLRRETKLRPQQVGAIIMTPTRELAGQVHSVCAALVDSVRKCSGAASTSGDGGDSLRYLQLVGGTSVTDDETAFLRHGGNIIVGTPGRIEDTLKRVPAFDTRMLEVLILDEADRMLDMGFQRSVTAILARLPKQRRTGLFSATQTQAVHDLVRAGLRNAVRVRVSNRDTAQPAEAGATAPSQDRTPDSLRNYYVICDAQKKLAHLSDTLCALRRDSRQCKVIVYFLTCACVDYFAKVFAETPVLSAAKNTRVLALHGRMKPQQRTKVYNEYCKNTTDQHGKVTVLFTTDLAARGLDIPDVDWVVQYDPPQNPDTFVHRVGRTARMGRSGAALVYLLPEEDAYVHFMQVRRVPLLPFDQHAEDHGCEPTVYKDLDSDGLSLLQAVKDTAKQDRDVFEKGERAFVSFVAGYQEHTCNFIFRWGSLKVADMAASFALLRMPRLKFKDLAANQSAGSSKAKKGSLPEILFVRDPIDTHTIKYKDRAREKQRQKKLKELLDTKSQRDALNAMPKAKRRKVQAEIAAASSGITPDVAEPLAAPDFASQVSQEQEDEDDMMRESRLLKKLKAGKITEAQFEERMKVNSRPAVVKKSNREKKLESRASKAPLRQRRSAKRDRLRRLAGQK